jgi:4-amino-4-deoxy-L-arabinose transferase-like glycosyltransferase
MNRTTGHFDKRYLFLLLLAILLAGSFVRFWGISSVYQRVDDIPVARQIETMYNGDWRPDPVYYYPIFFNYIVAIFLRWLSAFMRLVGLHKAAGVFPFSFEQILFTARFFSALMGSLTILVVYAIGKKLFSAREGLLAAFLFSVSFIHILFSHQIVLDVPMTLFYALAVYFCTRILTERRWTDYVLAGLTAGWAVATKYNGVFVLLAIFLAHWLSSPAARRKFVTSLFDIKIYLGGLSALAGFLIGHPYALLQFKKFIGASRVLLTVVHETEWFLTPIQPKTALEYIRYNKYVLALKNILTAEGVVFFGLIILGAAAMLVRRSKKDAFLGFSGLVYFLGALGYLGFSRFRDLPALAIFYAFWAMMGLLFLAQLLRKLRLPRAAVSALLILIVISLGWGALTRSYYLWEDDTTEIADRWIRRNISAGHYFGKEWFSPQLRGPGYSYASLNRPYLFSQDFAPYQRFDFIITSSASYGHFFQNEKFYPEIVRLYREVKRENELVKNFYFWSFEYKNPELNLLTTWSRNRKKERLSLPPALPLKSTLREFEIVDGSPYGKSIMSFFLHGGEKVERTIISRRRVSELAVFVLSAGGEGEIALKNFPTKKTLKVRAGEANAVILRPRLSFPFYRYIYRLSVQGSESLNRAFVKLCYNDFDIAQEFFRREDWSTARDYFLKALETRAPSGLDLEIYLYLGRCAKKLGLADETRRWRETAAADPLWPRYVRLCQSIDDATAFGRNLERFSGLDYRLLGETISESIDDAQCEFTDGQVLESRQFLEGRALLPAGGPAGKPLLAASPEISLYPQKYNLTLRFFNPSRLAGIIGALEIEGSAAEDGQNLSFPILLDPLPTGEMVEACYSFTCRSLEDRIRFVVRIDSTRNIAFDGLRFAPDIRDFFRKKSETFREFLRTANPVR